MTTNICQITLDAIRENLRIREIIVLELDQKYPLEPFGATSPLCYKQLGRGWGTSKHNCLVSYLLCWRHVSATVVRLQATKMYIEGIQPTKRSRWKFTICTYTMTITVYSFPLYIFLCPEDGPQWSKHVVSIINRIQRQLCFDVPHPLPNPLDWFTVACGNISTQ